MKSFPIQVFKAIGLKLDGEDGLSLAVFLLMSFMAANSGLSGLEMKTSSS